MAQLLRLQKRRRFSRGLLPLFVVAVGVTACSGGRDALDDVDLDSDDVALTSGLANVGGCDALLDRLIAEGLERVGPYGFGGGGYIVLEDQEASAVDEATAEGPAGDGGDADVTGTNNQEAGVDEPDLVKTDGERMVAAGSGTLMVLDLSAGVPRLERTIPIPDEQWVSELFFIDDTIYAMTTGWRDVALVDDLLPRHGGVATTRVSEIDVDTGETRRVLEIEGTTLSAREIDGTIRFVFSSPPVNFPFVYPSNPEAEERAEADNREILEDSTIDKWLPSYRITRDGETIDQGRLVACERMYLPGDFSGFGTVSVVTIDSADGLAPHDSVGVVTEGQTIYASTDRLTVATQRWPEWREDGSIAPDRDFAVSLHNFDITDPTETRYTASGAVRGHLLSRYSLSEYDGHLRVATTAGDPWNAERTSESFVTILAESDGSLRQVGQVGGLGKGEQIYAVRFVGPIGFVVTFRQTDPLYTIDLSDATDPTVLGELKIPGYSSYLHPIGQSLVLGVGQDATDEGATIGSQVSVFDLTDLAAPSRISQLLLQRDSYSAVEHEPRAFTWLDRDRLAIIPISWWDFAEGGGSNGSAAILVQVAGDGSLAEIGRIGHERTEECEDIQPLDEETLDEVEVEETDAEAGLVDDAESFPLPGEDHCWSFQPEILRSVVVNDTLYTLSDEGVQANRLGSLEPVAWVPFT